MTVAATKVSPIACPASPTFVVFSDDWGEHMSSSQHLFAHIARKHAVIWVNTVGMRTPALSSSDLIKAWRKLSKMCTPDRTGQSPSHASRVKVCQPFMLPYTGISAVRKMNARNVSRTLRRSLRNCRPEEMIVVATVPNAGDYCDAFPNAKVVYYCVDDFTQWPGIDAKIVAEMERRLIERAEVLVAASASLGDRLEGFGKPVHVLTHGVDLDLFGQRPAVEHACLCGIGKPRVGFFGLIDDRVDQALVVQVARRMPEVSFVAAGPITVAVNDLNVCTNVHLAGPMPYLELPAYVAGLDVLIIPYRVDSLGHSLSPLKLKEYLATGKPIVSTPIAGAVTQPCVGVAATIEEWVNQLRTALAVDSREREERIPPALQAESWSYKARVFVGLCEGRACEASTTLISASGVAGRAS